MRTSPISVLVLASTVFAAPSEPLEKRAPTVYLAGDSTMATITNPNQQGWGYYLPWSLSIPVVNNAIGGRSSRSYTVEGRFQAIADKVKSGDIVVIEFGHNDGGSLSPTDNGRSVCPGTGSETCKSTYNGQSVTVLTYPAYLQNAGNLLKSKGANVIFSSPTPNNPWEGGSFVYTPGRFTTYSKDSATKLGAGYVDHGAYTADAFKRAGKATTDGWFPVDHTHTSAKGADAVSKAFVKGLLCGNTILKQYVRNGTASVPGACL